MAFDPSNAQPMSAPPQSPSSAPQSSRFNPANAQPIASPGSDAAPPDGYQPLHYSQVPGTSHYTMDLPPEPKPQHGALRRAAEWVLTQGGRYDPATAASKLGRDALALLESVPPVMPEAAIVPAAKALRGVGEATSATAKVGGIGLSHLIGGLGTHTGAESIQQAFKAGKEGGEAAQLFIDSLRGNKPMEEVVDVAKDALAKMREARSQAYTTAMKGVTKDKTVLSFDALDKQLAEIGKAAYYEGKVVNPEAAARMEEIQAAISEWKDGDETVYHTVQGFDALKQRIGSILEKTDPHTKASAIAGRAYNAARDTIAEQAPDYAKVMKDYEEASTAVRDLESGLSLKDSWARKSSTDAAIRKLQTVMRNNANTNYGNRLRMVETLDKSSGGKIMPQLAGQSLSSVTPRGLGNIMAGGTALAGLNDWRMLGALPFQSPRLMGEAAYGVGASTRLPGAVSNWSSEAINRMLQSLGLQ